MNEANDAVPKSNSSQILSKVEGVLCSRPAWELPSHPSTFMGLHGHSCLPTSCSLCLIAKTEANLLCKILSSRDLFRPQADSPRLIRRSVAAALHRCTAPRSAPSVSPAASSKKWPSGPKNSNFRIFWIGRAQPRVPPPPNALAADLCWPFRLDETTWRDADLPPSRPALARGLAESSHFLNFALFLVLMKRSGAGETHLYWDFRCDIVGLDARRGEPRMESSYYSLWFLFCTLMESA